MSLLFQSSFLFSLYIKEYHSFHLCDQFEFGCFVSLEFDYFTVSFHFQVFGLSLTLAQQSSGCQMRSVVILSQSFILQFDFLFPFTEVNS